MINSTVKNRGKEMKKSFVYHAAFVLLPLLTACLSLEAEFDFRSKDSIRFSLVYVVSAELWNMGVFSDDTQDRVLPISKRDMDEAALLHDGVELKKYTVKQSDDTVTVSALYIAESAEALSGLWGSVNSRGLALTDNSFFLPLSFPQQAADMLQQELVYTILEDSILQIQFLLPDKVDEVGLYGMEFASLTNTKKSCEREDVTCRFTGKP